jgi:PKD repeat protein
MKPLVSIATAFIAITAAAQQTPLPYWAELMYSGADIGDVVTAYEAYYHIHPFEKNTHTQAYKRLQWRHTRDNNGALFGQPLDETKFSQRSFLNRSAQLASQRDSSNWTCIGPFDFDREAASRSYACGAAHVYTVEQSVSNTDVLYAGSANAGVWRTDNKGVSWYSLTDQMMIGTVIALEIDYTDANTCYFGGGGQIYKTTDGGTTWNMTGNSTFQAIHVWVNDLVMSPIDNQKLWAATDKALFYTSDGGTTWTTLNTGLWQEIEFKPGDPSVMYAIKQLGIKTEFHKSTDGGLSFTQRLGGYPVPTVAEEQKRTEIAVTPAAPSAVYAFCTGVANGGAGTYGFYVSHDAGETWTFNCCGSGPGGPPDPGTNKNLCAWEDDGSDDGGQYYYDLALEVSPFDSNEVHIGAVNHWISYDGGINWVCPSKWSHSSKPEYVHADIHDIHFYGSEWWFACDGGIFYSDNGGDTIARMMYGIAGTDFWGFGIGEWDGNDVMVGGTYHNGTLLKDFNTYNGGWLSTMGGDNILGAVNYGYPRIIFSDYGRHRLSGDRTVDLSNIGTTLLPKGSYWIGESGDMTFHPRVYNTVYIGRDSSIWVSGDNGVNYELLHSWGTGRITSIEIAPSEPNVLYACFYEDWWGDKRLYKSIDAGVTWSDITPNSSVYSTQLWAPLDIAVGDDPDHIWLVRTPQSSTYNNLNGYKVFKSTDGGATWTNLTTTTLDGEYITSIEYQRGTDGGVYIGTRRGVYYRNNAMSDWQLFNSGLPVSTTSVHLQIDYKEEKIVTATQRSVWTSPLFEPSTTQAQISVNSGTIYCPRDTVYFRDHSNASDANVTWSWSFPGGTPPSSIQRHPKVVYGQPGNYTVSLTVSDDNGTSTQTLNDFISVTDGCSPDSVPGKALSLDGTSGIASIPALNLNSNTVTMMAWIKPEAIQKDWSGLIFSRSGGTIAGLSIRTDMEVRMHWNATQWPWSSGLYATPGEWNHVALVITPDSGIIYVNGIASVNQVAFAPEEFDGTTMLGLDACCDRYFNGQMDEVGIYNRSLTQDEIREQMHLTKKPAEDPGLVAYYQFNELDGVITDRVGVRHATFGNGASRQRSTGPFGGGESERVTVTSGGQVTLNDVNLSMTFAQAGTYPDGELVISRLNNYPDEWPDSTYWNSPWYWIVDNYGSKQNFSQLDEVVFKGFYDLSPDDAADCALFTLYERPWYASGGTWNAPLDQADHCEAALDEVAFASGNGMTSFGQLAIVYQGAAPVGMVQRDNSVHVVPFIVYPNPISSGEQLVVKSQLTEECRFSLLDVTGRQILTSTFRGIASVELPELLDGPYVYRFESSRLIQGGIIVLQ